MNNKLLIICGPTAVGKTALAFYLAKKFNGELISADSRQVYKYMDIGTGKDWGDGSVKVWGYDLILPNEAFSVKNFVDFAGPKISEIQKRNKLPILVGGTGLYIKAVLDGIETINIPPDVNLREKFKNKSVDDLYKILKNLNHKKANSLNDSDKKNKIRLIRAIEIAKSKKPQTKLKQKYKFLMIGLNLEKEKLFKRIENRIQERLKKGFEKEKEFLKNKGFWEGAPSKTIGYKDGNWEKEEKSYAKRQLTWFKKDKKIVWFNIDEKNFQENVENLAQLWYKKKDASEI